MIHNPRLLKPTLNRVLVEKPKPYPKTTASGIILEVETKLVEENRVQEMRDKEIEDEHNFYEGTILAVGPLTSGIQKGDKVIVGKYAGAEVEHNSRIYLISETEIVATP